MISKMVNYDNWRGIALPSIPSKVMTRVISNRIEPVLESHLGTNEQVLGKDYAALILLMHLKLYQNNVMSGKERSVLHLGTLKTPLTP
jgi:hypothetical protein